ncbi:MAG TPA: CRTAC1 family protein [Gemmataceae bacterium]|nr:CRTAC1 family protein [Gemmataceae bacterium]
MILRRPSRLVASLVVAAAVLAAGCRPPARTAPQPIDDPPALGPGWFDDVTDRVGLDFVHDPGPLDGSYFMPQSIGSGAALFDFDGDGRLDIYLLQNGGPKSSSTNRLYKQMPDGKFKDVSKGSGLDIGGYSMGVAIGDVNNDGKPDVLVTQYGGLKLFLNNGDGTFTDVTEESGLKDPLWGVSASFFDCDRDGMLDLVVVNYVDNDPAWVCKSQSDQGRDYCSPNVFPGTVVKLFHNVTKPGGKPRFEDVTEASGLAKIPGPGLGVVCADFNGDGWPDIFIANDLQPNRLWINQRDGTFKEEAVKRGVGYDGMGKAQSGMGVAVGDVNGDGLDDIFVTHLGAETNTLWMQEPRGLFKDRTAASGLAAPKWHGTGWGTVLADFDLDGVLDLALVNGRVSRGEALPGSAALGKYWSLYAERNQLFAGDGKGRFRDLSPDQPELCGVPNEARGLAVGDVNNDGAPDLLVTTIGGKARLLINRAPKRGHWLTVRAVDPALKRDAIGAQVVVTAGGRDWMRRIDPGGSYLCSGDMRALFGLGKANAVDGIVVKWPDGSREQFAGGPADRAIELHKGEGRPAAEEKQDR